MVSEKTRFLPYRRLGFDDAIEFCTLFIPLTGKLGGLLLCQRPDRHSEQIIVSSSFLLNRKFFSNVSLSLSSSPSHLFDFLVLVIVKQRLGVFFFLRLLGANSLARSKLLELLPLELFLNDLLASSSNVDSICNDSLNETDLVVQNLPFFREDLAKKRLIKKTHHS